MVEPAAVRKAIKLTVIIGLVGIVVVKKANIQVTPIADNQKYLQK